MKIKDGFLLKEIEGDCVVIPVGENLVDFNSMIVLNKTGMFLWKELGEDKSEEQLIEAVVNEYEDVDEETARRDVEEFVKILREKDLVV
ncbi:MAG: hypothetical protein BWY15_00514 [Firmicutes bacterium ADurb.Bin193]|nr:MAG: hypothetical protein BWY15_00514 [Firmicutes bacterium ADurb.Bin193]